MHGTDHKSLRHQAERQHADRIKRHAGGQADMREDKAIADREVRKGFAEHDSQLHEGKKTHLKLRDGGHAEGGAAKKRLDRPGRRKRADGGGADADATALTRAVDAGLAKSLNPEPGQPRARGGAAHGKGKKGGHVNVIVATGAGQDRPVPVPVPVGGGMPPHPPMAPTPGPPMGGPMAGPPPGGMPPGMPPGGGGLPMGLAARPPMPGAGPGMPPIRARGGRINDAGEAHGKELADHSMAGASSGMGRLAKAKIHTADANAAGD